MSESFVGIDIGGTNTKVGIMSKSGELLSFAEGDTPQSGGPEAEIGLLAQVFEFLNISPDKVCGIGVGVPGPVDRNGIVYSPPNLRDWGIVDFAKMLSEYFGIPIKNTIFVGNDANLAAVAEYRFGNGAEADPMVMLTLGTGVGGAVIIEGKPMLGKNGFAAELGHITIDPNGPRCGCGRKGCAEALISHSGIVRTAWNILRKDKGSLIWSMIEGRFDALTPKTIQQAADLGDPTANKVLKITAEYLAILIANLINIFNPARVVIGGGIARWGDVLLNPARKKAKKSALKHLAKETHIVRAKFHQKAGVIGAAAAVIHKTKPAE